MTAPFGPLTIGSVGYPAPGRPGVRDELMWRWKQQFLHRPFPLRLRSGRFAAHTVLLPEGWSPEQGTVLPIGEVRHLVLARRLHFGDADLQHAEK